jgi:hypothetical protein
MTTTPRTIDILLATREASRAAHRWRDAAASYYDAGSYGLATRAKEQKNLMYQLKDAGIAALHRSGLLRYIGASPQGMAVYEYGDGGMSCLHSTLHPDGVERTPVEAHPEVLHVTAKKAKVRMVDVAYTLLSYFSVGVDDKGYVGYSRSSSPTRRAPITCYECGEEGHISRYCPLREDDDFDEPWPEVRA